MSGSPPCSRHGHVSVAVGTDILIHGGMAGTDMFDDLYKFNTGNAIIVKSNNTYVVLLCEFSYTCREIECSCKRSIKRSGVTVLRFKVLFDFFSNLF